MKLLISMCSNLKFWLSLLGLKCKYCIAYSKNVCLVVLGKNIDVIDIKMFVFYVTIDKIARNWSYNGSTDLYLFFLTKSVVKLIFIQSLGLKIFFFVELILFSKFSTFAFLFSFLVDFLKLWMFWILFWKGRSFY